MVNQKELDILISTLKERDNYLITSHVKPEGDSIGSQLAIKYYLDKIGKSSVMVDQDKIPENLLFLSDTKNIHAEIPMAVDIDTVLFVDCPVRERAGSSIKGVDENIFTINIDHHISNEYYGDVNWVEGKMSSVGEMMFHLLQRAGVGMDLEVMRAIYAAIITDTGMFNYDNTTGATHKVVAELIDGGVNPKEMHKAIFEKKNLVDLKILGKVLSTLKTEQDNRIAYITLTRDMVKEENLEYVSTEEFINYPRAIKGVKIAVFFNENVNVPDSISISFRSNGEIDVNQIASQFGGGGHRNASGCYLACSLRDAREKVLEHVRKVVNEKS